MESVWGRLREIIAISLEFEKAAVGFMKVAATRPAIQGLREVLAALGYPRSVWIACAFTSAFGRWMVVPDRFRAPGTVVGHHEWTQIHPDRTADRRFLSSSKRAAPCAGHAIGRRVRQSLPKVKVSVRVQSSLNRIVPARAVHAFNLGSEDLIVTGRPSMISRHRWRVSSSRRCMASTV